MASHREHVQDYIENSLPRSFGSSSISGMCADLERDRDLIKSSGAATSQKKMEMVLHERHKKLAFSYPSLFFKIVRGEVDPGMLKSLLKLKEDLDDKSISLKDARNRVIDCARHQIEETKDEPRVRKAKPAGTVVQELNFKCKPDDS